MVFDVNRNKFLQIMFALELILQLTHYRIHANTCHTSMWSGSHTQTHTNTLKRAHISHLIGTVVYVRQMYVKTNPKKESIRGCSSLLLLLLLLDFILPSCGDCGAVACRFCLYVCVVVCGCNQFCLYHRQINLSSLKSAWISIFNKHRGFWFDYRLQSFSCTKRQF